MDITQADPIHLLMGFIVCVAVLAILVTIFRWRSDNHSEYYGDKIQTIAKRSNPKHSAFRAKHEFKKSAHNTALNLQVAAEIVSVEVIERVTRNAAYLHPYMDMEYAEHIAQHVTTLLSHQNHQAALRHATEQKIRLAVLETIILSIHSGPMGEVLTEYQKRKLLGPLEIEHKRLEHEVEVNAMLDAKEKKHQLNKRLNS